MTGRMAGTSSPQAHPWVARFREWAHLEPQTRRRHVERETPSESRPRGPRRRRLVIVALAVLFAYPVLGTLALWTGLVERLVRSEHLRVELENPAYTLWPGQIHVKHACVLLNSDTQFILEGDDLFAHVELFSLLGRKFHVTKLSADGVRYQMRTQVESEEGIEKRIAAFPPLEGLPGENVIRKKPEPKTGKSEKKGYTVEIEGIDVGVDELWFFEYRYLGEGRLRGGFLVGPDLMQVETAVQEIGPGELRFGADHVIADNVRGQITADIPRVNPSERADLSFFELVTARTELRADLRSLAHLDAYLDGISVEKGAGPLAVDLYMDKGFLGPNSRLDYRAESLGVLGKGFGVATDLRLDLNASAEGSKDRGKPLLRSSAKATYVSFAGNDRTFTVQIHGHEEEVALDRIRLSGATKIQRAAVRMPEIVSVDLDDLGALLPEGTPYDARSGELRASVALEMDQDYQVRGPVQATVQNADFSVAGIRIRGDAALTAQANMNPKVENYLVDSVVLSLRNIGMRAGGASVGGWWMDVTSPRLALWNATPNRFETTVKVRARDLEPLLEALAEKDEISDLIPLLTTLYDFRAKATVRTQGETTDVTLESESRVWDVSGRLYKKGERSQMAFVVGGQAVSLGIAKLGDDGLEVMPFAKTDWLNARLRRLPRPLELPPEKP
jgi:hypothetical protein